MNPTSTPRSFYKKTSSPGISIFYSSAWCQKEPQGKVTFVPRLNFVYENLVTKSDISSSHGLAKNWQKGHLARGMIWIFALISTIRRHEVIPVTGTNKLDNTERIWSSTGEDISRPINLKLPNLEPTKFLSAPFELVSRTNQSPVCI